MAVVCDVCEKMFSTRFNLNKHIYKVHNSTPNIVSYDRNVWNYKCLESECNSSFRQNNGLIKHLRQEHNLPFEEESLDFQDLTSFQVWKTTVEEQYKCSYILSSTFRNKKGLHKYYICNRSGKIMSKSQNKRRTKKQGSCKLNRACTSQIHILEPSLESKQIIATWKKTHYGHPVELQHIRILKKDRAAVATKLASGVPTARILDGYRDNIGQELKRVDMIQRQDISNIKSSYHINITDGVKHKNDAMSVDLWVRECEADSQNNAVLFYKRQGEVDSLNNLSNSDFCLIIMTIA